MVLGWTVPGSRGGGDHYELDPTYAPPSSFLLYEMTHLLVSFSLLEGADNSDNLTSYGRRPQVVVPRTS